MTDDKMSRPLTISVSPEMLKDIETISEAEHRSRSELVREALRFYLKLRAPVAVSQRQRRRIERGRKQIARGEFLTLVELDRPRRATRRKGR